MTNTQHDSNFTFLQSKGYDTSSLSSLQKARHQLCTTDGDNIMYGETSDDDFDKMVGDRC